MFPRAVTMQLLDVFGARACAAEFVSTVEPITIRGQIRGSVFA
jgi:hypothetical protein